MLHDQLVGEGTFALHAVIVGPIGGDGHDPADIAQAMWDARVSAPSPRSPSDERRLSEARPCTVGELRAFWAYDEQLFADQAAAVVVAGSRAARAEDLGPMCDDPSGNALLLTLA